MVAAEVATCCAWRHTFASSGSTCRSVTAMKSHRCWFMEDGARRPASRIRSRSSEAIGRTANRRTFRRARMASHVSMRAPFGLREELVLGVWVFRKNPDLGELSVADVRDDGAL